MAMPRLQEGIETQPIICPTREEQGAIGRTVYNICCVVFARGKAPCYVHANCVGYARVRTNSFVETMKTLDGITYARGFLLDDDILLQDQGALFDACEIADRNGWNIVAPYRATNGKIVVCNSEGDMLTPEQFSKLKPYQEVPMAGLGFYYGDIPLTYEFHADGKPFNGEDLNFWYDNPQLKPRIAPVPVKHCKVIAI